MFRLGNPNLNLHLWLASWVGGGRPIIYRSIVSRHRTRHSDSCTSKADSEDRKVEQKFPKWKFVDWNDFLTRWVAFLPTFNHTNHPNVRINVPYIIHPDGGLIHIPSWYAANKFGEEKGCVTWFQKQISISQRHPCDGVGSGVFKTYIWKPRTKRQLPS